MFYSLNFGRKQIISTLHQGLGLDRSCQIFNILLALLENISVHVIRLTLTLSQDADCCRLEKLQAGCPFGNCLSTSDPLITQATRENILRYRVQRYCLDMSEVLNSNNFVCF